MTVRGPDSKSRKLGSSATPAKSTKVSKSEAKAAKAPAKSESKAPVKNQARNAAAAEDKKGQSAFASHTATVDVVTDEKLSRAAAGGKRVADAVMQVIGSYDKTFLLDTDGLKAHVTQVATKFMEAADAADQKGSVYSQLKSKFPGAQISLVGTASLKTGDQVEYLVRTQDGNVRKFVDAGGKAVEKADASGAIFMAADLGKPGSHMAVRVPEVRFLINPTLPPSYGVGRQIGVVMDQDLAKLKKNAGDQVSSEMSGVYRETLPGTTQGEDGKPLAVVYSTKREMKGVILKYNGDHTYDVQLTLPDGTKQVVKQSESQIRSSNDPMVFNLHGSTFDDVSINVDQDPVLKDFLGKAKAVADKDIPKSGTPAEIAAGQKQALVDLTILCNTVMSYPDEDANTTDENSKKAMALINGHSNWDPMKFGDLISAGRGVCRHQAILMQLACQTAGIASRTVSATANDRQGNFRGYHAFLETTLDDGSQFLTDPTWFDAGPKNVKGYNFSPVVNGQQAVGTPLWDTLYQNVLRQVLPTWQDNASDEDHNAIKFNESNNPVVDANGAVVTGGSSSGGTGGATGGTTPGGDAKAVLGAILGDLAKYHLTNKGDVLTRGDAYMKSGAYGKAAKDYAFAIQSGAHADKATWQKLADALGKANLAADAARAKQIADAL